jgi:hypothetical protein
MSSHQPRRRLDPERLTEEDAMMYNHPAFAAALAEQRSRALIAEARSARLARAARAARAARSARDGSDGGTERSARWFVPRRKGLARLRPARAR